MPAFSAETNPLLRLSLALLLASLAGEAAARFLRLPRITGYSLIGLLIGASGLGWFTAEDLDGWRVVINLALALLLFEMGMRVDLQWFRANRMLLASSVAEAILSFLTVYAVMRMLDAAVPLSAAVAAIAMATSPAVVMRVAAELRANGQVTNRLIVLAALNVIYSAVALNLIIGGLHGVEGRGWGAVILHPLYLIVGPVLVAIGLAFAFRWLRRHFDFSDEEGAAVLLGLLLLSVAILDSANLPVVLAPLLAGIIVKNTDRRPHLWPRHFGTAGGLLVILLFVLTGVSLTWNQIIAGGLAALALILARFLGKAVGVIALGPASGLSWRQSAALAMALLPMSGVAFVLVLDFRAIFPAQGDALAAIVFSMVAILELAGPIAVQFALRLTGEARGRKA